MAIIITLVCMSFSLLLGVYLGNKTSAPYVKMMEDIDEMDISYDEKTELKNSVIALSRRMY